MFKRNKLFFIGYLFVLFLGIFLHFSYELSGNNFYVGLFSAVNESVWEHLKLGVFAGLIFMIYDHIKLGDKKNYIPSKLKFSLVYMVSVVVMHYIFKLIFKEEIVIVNILNYIISVTLAWISSYIVLNKNEVSDNVASHSKYIFIILIIAFIAFTVYPPFTELFKDSISNTYGIFKLEGKLN